MLSSVVASSHFIFFLVSHCLFERTWLIGYENLRHAQVLVVRKWMLAGDIGLCGADTSGSLFIREIDFVDRQIVRLFNCVGFLGFRVVGKSGDRVGKSLILLLILEGVVECVECALRPGSCGDGSWETLVEFSHTEHQDFPFEWLVEAVFPVGVVITKEIVRLQHHLYFVPFFEGTKTFAWQPKMRRSAILGVYQTTSHSE